MWSIQDTPTLVIMSCDIISCHAILVLCPAAVAQASYKLVLHSSNMSAAVLKFCDSLATSKHRGKKHSLATSKHSKPALQTDHSKVHSQTLWVDNFCQLGKIVTVQMCFCSSIWLVDWCCQIEVSIVENFPQMIPGSLLRDTHNMPDLFPIVLFFHSQSSV